MEWREKYPKSAKPAYNDLLDFFQPNIRNLFLSFDHEMNERFGVFNKYHHFTETAGWAYGFGRNYNCKLLTVTVSDDCFYVLSVCVTDEDSLQNALAKAQIKYDCGFEERYAKICAARRESQSARARVRVAREKEEMTKITDGIDPAKFNKFKWIKKVPRNDLMRLYQSDAKGLLDEELLDEIGHSFYSRCVQAQEAYSHMEKGEIICLHCNAVLAGETSQGRYGLHVANTPIHCECGHSYTFREYRRSCNSADMPAGAADPIFDEFVQKWSITKDAKAKMMLIDWLIHQFHVKLMADVKGRSVCKNLIEGTTAQISDLINKLAYE